MHITASFPVAQVDGAKVLRLYYKRSDIEMLFVLPDRVDGLADMESSLTPARIDAWVKATQWNPKVIVSLPSFRFDPKSPVMLRDELAALGMADAFDRDKADFTGIAKAPNPSQSLYLGVVIHKSFVKVDERGAEATAATVAIMATPMSIAPPGDPPPPPPPFVFNADHPFLFFIMDHRSGLILFMGRVADPSSA
jgi:serpin B